MNLHKSTIPARRTFAAVLSAAMLIPSVSFATSNDQNAAEELKAILTAQQEQSTDSLLEETLGLSQAGFCRKPQSFWASRIAGAIPPVHSLPGSIQS